MTERITAVALRHRSPAFPVLALLAPARHADLFHYASSRDWSRDAILGAEQGFLTSAGRFVTRREALPIARAAGQFRAHRPARPDEYSGPELFSEDLW